MKHLMLFAGLQWQTCRRTRRAMTAVGAVFDFLISYHTLYEPFTLLKVFRAHYCLYWLRFLFYEKS